MFPKGLSVFERTSDYKLFRSVLLHRDDGLTEGDDGGMSFTCGNTPPEKWSVRPVDIGSLSWGHAVPIRSAKLGPTGRDVP